ncbi:hypothetical protein BD779DRAFT_1548971 [Infundibulicybe gibba]|nr:hypothetical protein BD779DRAFT_1548971 [Infundibulicybe gibba]
MDIQNLRSKKSWKVMLRCWVACWGSFLILLPNASLRTMGTAWGIGVAAMRAANASRSQALLQAAFQQVQASAAASPALQANPTLARTIAVFNGTFLDIRSTAVYGCFLVASTFFFALIRAYAPKLLFMSVFGTIAMDIFCTIGPLFPTAQYTLLKSTAISVSCYMAIGLLTTIFIFPETVNHSCLSTVADQLGRVKRMVELQDEVLQLLPSTEISGVRSLLIRVQQQVMALSGLLSLEFSWGKWNSDDIHSLEGPLLTMVARVAALHGFSKLAQEGQFGLDTTFLLRQVHQHNSVIEKTHNLRTQDMLPIIREATAPLRAACVRCLDAIQKNVQHVNSRRWKNNAKLDVEQLQDALAAFNTTQRLSLVEPFMPLFKAAHTKAERDALPVRTLYVGYVFGANMISISGAIIQFAEKVSSITAHRQRNRLWAPTGLRNLWKLLAKRGDEMDGGVAFGDEFANPEVFGDQREGSYRRDPDSRPPENIIQKIMDRLHNLYHWTKTAEAIFVFKYVFVSVALWFPAVVRRTALADFITSKKEYGAYYKTLRALIMAQTTINIYAADQIYNLVTRLMGTAIGLIFGLIAWYAGNGRGNGNPYGVAATMGVVLIPFIFVRVYAPPQYLPAVILACATFALVVGYSWVDGHLAQFASPGIGWSVAWRRWVLVVIGAAASFFMMMLPPTSGRKAVRMRNASSITALSHVYRNLVSTWISNPTDESDGAAAKRNGPAAWLMDFRQQLIRLTQEMQGIQELTQLAKWEGSIRGAWPSEEYKSLVDVQIEMIASLAKSLAHLDTEWRLSFLHKTRRLTQTWWSVDKLFYHHHRAATATPLIWATPQRRISSLDELHRITKNLCGEVPLHGFGEWKDQYEQANTARV